MKASHRVLLTLGVVGVTLTGCIGASSVSNTASDYGIPTRTEVVVQGVKDKNEKFTIKDKAYFNDLLSKNHSGEISDKELVDRLTLEVDQINDLILRHKQDYEEISGARVYKPQTSERVHYLYESLNNRIDYLNKYKTGTLVTKFNYSYGEFKDGIDHTKEYYAGTPAPEGERERIFNEVKRVLEESEYPEGLLENTIIVISPFKAISVNGYAYSEGFEGKDEVIVLTSSIGNVQETLNHELGHILQYTLTNLDKESKEWQEYLDIYGVDCNQGEVSWEEDTGENFAEDFRVHLEGEEATPKRTKFQTKPKEFNQYLDKNLGEINTKIALPQAYLKLTEFDNLITLTKGKNISYVTQGDQIEIVLGGEEEVANDNLYLIVKQDGKQKEYRIRNNRRKITLKGSSQIELIVGAKVGGDIIITNTTSLIKVD